MKRFLAAAVLLAACAQPVWIKPVNRSQEPVFYPGHHAALGMEALAARTHDEKETGYHQPQLLLNPLVGVDVNVSPWAGFSVVPVYWKFLLTGEQYSPAGRLRIRRPHAMLSGGLTGISFLGTEGPVITGDATLAFKWLPIERGFLAGSLALEFFDIRKPQYFETPARAELGFQATEAHSASLLLGFSRFREPADKYVEEKDLIYLDGDAQAEAALQHAWYLRRKHIFTTRAGLGWKNESFSRHHFFQAGFGYQFVFN